MLLFAGVPVEKGLSPEHAGELLADPHEQLLGVGGVLWSLRESEGARTKGCGEKNATSLIYNLLSIA